jgi:diguanylate cyclase (GGDEF)-like protein
LEFTVAVILLALLAAAVVVLVERRSLLRRARAAADTADELQTRIVELDAERGRLRIAIDRFGEALASTNDVEQLLPVVAETAVEATGAVGATIRSGGLAAAAGNRFARGERLEHQLVVGGESLGTLTLVGTFGAEERMTAASIAAHAAVALQNARLHAVVERQAMVDALTGIANRRACEDAFAQEVARAGRIGSSLALVVADLDDFKRINDRYGHEAGDDVLREFASVLRLTLRGSDLPGRWGGEEFVLLLPGADAEGGAELAGRVRAGLGERAFRGRDGAIFGVTCSFGVAELCPGEGERELFARADRALYEAKRHGKNRVEWSSRIHTVE